MKALIEKNDKIESCIYEIRGTQVMLDSDLARLYKCTNGTKDINKAVSRNKERFPDDFYFQLTQEEFVNLKFQIGTSSKNNHGGIRKLPHVFTEQGVAMLASILRTEIAAQMSIAIMRAFVMMRKYISTNLLEQKYINTMVLEDHNRIDALESSFEKLEEKKKINEIYFNGQIYDAYSKIQEIFENTKKSLVIIDAYADKTILDIIKRLSIEVTIITKSNNLLTSQDVLKYNKQYHNLKVIYDNTFHDRYFILDESKVYHCGASINRIGYKTFSITQVSDQTICQLLILSIKSLA